MLCGTVEGGDGFNHYKVRARMAIMDKNFKLAEGIYLEQVCSPLIHQLANMFYGSVSVIHNDHNSIMFQAVVEICLSSGNSARMSLVNSVNN